MTNLIFIGGIHGAGKGAICRKICEKISVVHITASEVLKWDEISELDNKNVDNIQNTQERLLRGLSKTLKKNKSYLLDGHFCLFNSEGVVEKIPMETFQKISPRLVTVVTEEINKIKERLEERDQKTYDPSILKNMQATEIEYAQQISKELNIPFFEIKNGDFQPLLKLIE